MESIRAFIDKTSELAANGGYKVNGDETEGNAVCGQGIYDHPLTVITRQEYLDNEAYFDELWATAKALADSAVNAGAKLACEPKFMKFPGLFGGFSADAKADIKAFIAEAYKAVQS